MLYVFITELQKEYLILIAAPIVFVKYLGKLREFS